MLFARPESGVKHTQPYEVGIDPELFYCLAISPFFHCHGNTHWLLPCPRDHRALAGESAPSSAEINPPAKFEGVA